MPKHQLENDEPAGKRHKSSTKTSSHTEPVRPQILPPLLVEPWKVADIPSQLPPLPRIHDDDIESQVFKHPGFIGDGPSYERLEWLGDAYLEMIATSLIFQTFTHTPSGRCSQLRELLIRNTNLAEYFTGYALMSRAKIPSDVSTSRKNARGRSSDKDLIKIQGDMFEAYIAAVIVSDPTNGLAVAAQWLRALFSITIKDEITQNEDSLRRRIITQTAPITSCPPSNSKSSGNVRGGPIRDPSSFPPKDQLTRLIGAKGIRIEYRDIPGPSKDEKFNLPLFSVGVYLTGWGENERLLGTGTALGKKEAGQIAATAALQQKELMSEYEAKKRAYMEEL